MSRRRQAPRKTLVADARRVQAACIATGLRVATQRAGRVLERHLAPSGLSPAQFRLMTVIAAAEDDSVAALAERMGLDQSTLSRNLRALERAGLAEIAAVEADLRRRTVWLTEAGARRLEAALPLWREAQARLAEAIAPAQVGALLAATEELA